MVIHAKVSPMQFLLNTANGYDELGLPVKAYSIFERRISDNTWYLYDNTRNRNAITKGASMVFYVSDEEIGGAIWGSATVKEKKIQKNSRLLRSDIYTVHSTLSFENIKLLKCPISFKSLLPELSFCPKNMSRWGVIVLGGTRRISDEDYEIILSKIQDAT